MSALIYSREALHESRETQAAEEQKASPQLSIFDQVPVDAPMPEGLVLCYWADWLGERGEFVSREKYLATMPIERVRAQKSDAAPAIEQDPAMPRKKAGSKRRTSPDLNADLFQCNNTD
jgi:hypothetical protein